MWTWTFAVMAPSSAAGGEQPDQRGRGVPPNGVVDVALLAAALHQARAAQDVEVVRERGSGDLHRLLDLAGRDLARRAHEEEEHLQPREMGEGLEGLDVLLARLEPRQRERER